MKNLIKLLPLVCLTLLVSCGSKSTNVEKLEECINGNESVCQTIEVEPTPEPTPIVEPTPEPTPEATVSSVLAEMDLRVGDRVVLLGSHEFTVTAVNSQGTSFAMGLGFIRNKIINGKHYRILGQRSFRIHNGTITKNELELTVDPANNEVIHYNTLLTWSGPLSLNSDDTLIFRDYSWDVTITL